MSKLIIIGGGTAGITLALRMLEKREDLAVTLVDAGPPVIHGNQRIWLDYVAQEKSNDPYAQLKDRKEDQELVNDSILDIRGSRYFGVGGSTNAWGGWCLRYKPEDFFLKTNCGEGADWPFDYKTLEPYYKKAEETLWVAGEEKPNTPLPFTLKDGVIIEAFNALGISKFGHLPLARRSSCQTIGTCKYCPIKMRYIPQPDLDTIISRYSNRFTLLHSTVALRLLMKSKTQCKGVEVFDKSEGVSKTIEGDTVVLSSGAIESPKLLLASKSEDWKDGIGNNSNQVGKHISAHPLVRVVGHRAGNPDNLEQPVDFPTLACRHFDDERHQDKGKLFFVRDGRKNATVIEEEILKGRSIAEIRNSMKDKLPFELRGFIEVFSHEDNFVSLGDKRSSFGGFTTKVNFKKTAQINKAIAWAEVKLKEILLAAGCEEPEAETYSTIRADHATSTCRMGNDSTNSVVDADLKVFGTDNVFVCSNAVIPNGSAVNPTLTLIALTEKLADHFESQY